MSDALSSTSLTLNNTRSTVPDLSPLVPPRSPILTRGRKTQALSSSTGPASQTDPHISFIPSVGPVDSEFWGFSVRALSAHAEMNQQLWTRVINLETRPLIPDELTVTFPTRQEFTDLRNKVDAFSTLLATTQTQSSEVTNRLEAFQHEMTSVAAQINQNITRLQI